MFRTMYDTDVTVWSPQGRLLQVEYAMEAVKQGSACLGIVGSKYVVLAALKRSPHDLAAYQKKLLKIDDHVGVAIAGLNADARTLAAAASESAAALHAALAALSPPAEAAALPADAPPPPAIGAWPPADRQPSTLEPHRCR